MRDRNKRWLALAVAVVVLAAACGDDTETTDPVSTAEGAHEDHPDTTTTLSSDDSATDGHGNAHEHTHGAATTPAVEPYESVTLKVSEDEATLETDDSMDTQDSTEHDMSDMDSEGADSSDGMNHPKGISIEIVDGEPVGGHQRVEVDLNSEVAISVTSDHAEEVHVHGYDILHAVSPGQPLHFSFAANIPGVFEVELEGSGRLLLQLTVS